MLPFSFHMCGYKNALRFFFFFSSSSFLSVSISWERHFFTEWEKIGFTGRLKSIKNVKNQMSQFVHSLPSSFIILSVTPQQHGRVGSFFDNHSTFWCLHRCYTPFSSCKWGSWIFALTLIQLKFFRADKDTFKGQSREMWVCRSTLCQLMH